MDFIIKITLAAGWLILVPLFCGSLFLRKNETASLIERFLVGYLFVFSLAELLIIPMFYLKLPLHIFTITYGLLLLVCALIGLVLTRKSLIGSARNSIFEIKKLPLVFWGAILLILFQMAVVVIYGHLDADDSLYVGMATSSIQADSIYLNNCYTGRDFLLVPRRYFLSPFPLFLAVISQLSNGLHPAIMAHTVFPAVFLPSAYLVLYLISRRWFPQDRKSQGTFLFLSAVLFWFSAYSVYNSGSFQMIRIWQGKATLAAVLLPFIFYLSLSIVMEEKPQYPWLIYGMANLAACLLSSMGIILTPFMMGAFALLSLIRNRRLKPFFFALLCCLPTIILGSTYVIVPLLRRLRLL